MGNLVFEQNFLCFLVFYLLSCNVLCLYKNERRKTNRNSLKFDEKNTNATNKLSLKLCLSKVVNLKG